VSAAVFDEQTRYQQRSLKPPPGWLLRLARLYVRIAVIASLLLIIFELFAVLLPSDLAYGSPLVALIFLYTLPTLFIVPAALGMHIALWGLTLVVAAQTVVRDKEPGHWDLLRLTGIDVRGFLFSKWLAVLRRMLPMAAVLVVLRAGVTIYAGMEFPRVASAGSTVQIQPYTVPPDLSNLLISMGTIALLTVANLIFTASIGVLASSLARRPGVATLLAVILRILVPVVVAAVLILLGRDTFGSRSTNLIYLDSDEFPRVVTLFAGGVSLLDNGSIFSAALAREFSQPVSVLGTSLANYYRPHFGNTYLAGLLIALLAYGLLSYGALRFAQAHLVRLGLIKGQD
jgi:hypothetical protein